MKTLVLYYSLTGTTATLANSIATALDAPTATINCPRYRLGWFSYLLAGYDSVKGRHPKVLVPDAALSDYDLLVLGASIWTSYPALPLRTFLNQNPDISSRVALFFTYGGHSPPEKAVDFASDLLSKPPMASLTVPHERVVQGDYLDDLERFVSKLKKTDVESRPS